METGNNQIETIKELVDEAYDSSAASSQYLSIQVSLDGLSFCIRNKEKFQVLKHYDFIGNFSWTQASEKAEQIIRNEKLNRQKFALVQVSFLHQKFNLVPSPLFDPAKQKDYLKLNAELAPDDLVVNDQLKSVDARNIYAVPASLEKMFRRNFGPCKFSHHTSVLIESFMGSSKNIQEKRLFLNISKSLFDLVLISGNKLEFCNTFKHYSNEDVAYYLLFVCEQLKLNPEKIKLFISGDAAKQSPLFQLLHRYVRNIEFTDRDGAFSYSYKFDELPVHSYYSLLKL